MNLPIKLSRNHLSLAGILFAAVLLVSISVPRFLASVSYFDSNAILLKIKLGENLDAEEYDALIAALEKGLSIVENGNQRTDLGFARILRKSAGQPQPDDSSDLLEKAMDDLTKGLSEAPFNPYAWLRLAHVQLALDGPSVSVATSLKNSIQLAEYEPKIIIPRLEYCLINWDYFSDLDKKIVYQQILYAWSLSPEQAYKMANTHKRISIFQAALISDKDLFRQFGEKINE